MDFADKTVLVTGGTWGIGSEAAKVFAARGATVFITGRSAERGNEVAAEIGEASSKAQFVQADLRSGDDIRARVRATGPVDVLVNNAGARELALSHEISEPGFNETPWTRSRDRGRSSSGTAG